MYNKHILKIKNTDLLIFDYNLFKFFTTYSVMNHDVIIPIYIIDIKIFKIQLKI